MFSSLCTELWFSLDWITSARSSGIGLLNTVHHQGLRLALGTFHTSPVQNLYIEANKPSLNNRRTKLAMQYVVKLKTNALNPAYNCIFEAHDDSAYESRPNYIQPLRLRIKPHIEALGVDLDVLEDTSPVVFE